MPVQNQMTTKQMIKVGLALGGLVLLTTLRIQFDLSLFWTAASLVCMLGVIYFEQTCGYLSQFFFQLGNYPRALKLANLGLRFDNENAYCLTYAAYSLMKLDRGSEAYELLNRVGGNKPQAWLLDARGWSKFQQGEFFETAELAEQYIETAPRTWNGYYMRAINNICSGSSEQFPQAETDVEKIIELAPQVMYGYYARAQLKLHTNKIDECIEDCQAALKLEPKNTDAMLLIACAYLSCHRLVEAEEAVQKVLKRAQAESELKAAALRVRGALFLARNMPEASARDLQESIQLMPSGKKYSSSLALALSRQNRGAEAMEFINEVIALNAQCAQAFVCRAAIKIRQEDYEGALGDLDTAESLHAYFPHAASARAWIYWKTNRFPEALEQADLALEKLKHSNSYATRALALVGVGKLDDAQKDAEIATTIDIDSLEGWLSLGVVEAARGNFEKALEHYDHVLTYDSKKMEALRQKALAFEKLGDKKQSELNQLKYDQLKNSYMEERCEPLFIGGIGTP